MSILYAFGERKQKYVIEKESVRGILIDKEGRLLMLTSLSMVIIVYLVEQKKRAKMM